MGPDMAKVGHDKDPRQAAQTHRYGHDKLASTFISAPLPQTFILDHANSCASGGPACSILLTLCSIHLLQSIDF